MSKNRVISSEIDRKSYGSLSIEEDGSATAVDTAVVEQDHCSVFQTTCNLVSVLTGSGMLSLPYAAEELGWSAIALLVFLCLIFMYSFELLACSIETTYCRENSQRGKHISQYHIDYLSFGKLAFGEYGDKLVLLIFGTEVSLALVSFLMNIGINLHVIDSRISVSMGIVLSAILTCIMSFTNLKTVSFSSAVGLALTLLTVVAIFASGLQLQDAGMLSARQYKTFDIKGLPIALGLVAFCFGGHGTFPRMYTTMAERHRYREVLWQTAGAVLLIYAVIMVSGYWFFAQFTLSPVTMNIGRDLQYHDTPHGIYWKVIAALGIICNLQVTCPIVTFALRDMAAKIIDFEQTKLNQRVTVVAILVTVTPVALLLSGHFPAVCSLIGSFATIANSVLLPMLFYHTVHSGDVPLPTLVLHGAIVVVALAATCVGMYANFGTLLSL